MENFKFEEHEFEVKKHYCLGHTMCVCIRCGAKCIFDVDKEPVVVGPPAECKGT